MAGCGPFDLGTMASNFRETPSTTANSMFILVSRSSREAAAATALRPKPTRSPAVFRESKRSEVFIFVIQDFPSDRGAGHGATRRNARLYDLGHFLANKIYFCLNEDSDPLRCAHHYRIAKSGK